MMKRLKMKITDSVKDSQGAVLAWLWTGGKSSKMHKAVISKIEEASPMHFGRITGCTRSYAEILHALFFLIAIKNQCAL